MVSSTAISRLLSGRFPIAQSRRLGTLAVRPGSVGGPNALRGREAAIVSAEILVLVGRGQPSRRACHGSFRPGISHSDGTKLWSRPSLAACLAEAKASAVHTVIHLHGDVSGRTFTKGDNHVGT